MHKLAIAEPIAARLCGRCGSRLTLSNKDNPPRCYNTAACESRAKKRPGVLKRIHATTVPVCSEESAQVIAEVSEQFNFSPELLCNSSGEHKYGRARRVLCYLLVQDAKLTALETGRILGGRTAASVYAYKKEVTDHFADFEKDVGAIRLRLVT